jgi:hypothetical protein
LGQLAMALVSAVLGLVPSSNPATRCFWPRCYPGFSRVARTLVFLATLDGSPKGFSGRFRATLAPTSSASSSRWFTPLWAYRVNGLLAFFRVCTLARHIAFG